MLISPEEYVSNLIDRDLQLNPSGIDLTVSKVERFVAAGQLDFDNSNRVVASGEEAPLELSGGEAYRITYNEVISVPSDATGIVFPRSSLMRNGAHLVSAVWDPGYEGRGQGLLQVLNPHGLKLSQNARIGQIIFLRLEDPPSQTYQGDYQGENL